MRNVFKMFIAFALASVMVIGTSFATALATVYWYTHRNEFKAVEQTEQTNSNVVIGGEQGNGIEIARTMLAMKEYAAYGVMPTAETAYTLTAMVTPAGSENKLLDWSIAWANADSAWAQGKEVTDYVTLEPVTVGGMTATVSCLQAFGEQVVITVKSQADASKFATCTVDYAQKVTSASLNFGNLPIQLGGSTAVQYEIGKGIQGMGGKVNASVETSDVYTLAEEFTYSVKLSAYADYVGTGNHFSVNDLSVTGAGNFEINTEYYGEEIYFDYDHDIVHWYIMQRTGDIYFKNLTPAEIAAYLDNITTPGLYQVELMVMGVYGTYTATSQVYCSGYKNSTPINAVALDLPRLVF
jgi:hypothetical protein